MPIMSSTHAIQQRFQCNVPLCPSYLAEENDQEESPERAVTEMSSRDAAKITTTEGEPQTKHVRSSTPNRSRMRGAALPEMPRAQEAEEDRERWRRWRQIVGSPGMLWVVR